MAGAWREVGPFGAASPPASLQLQDALDRLAVLTQHTRQSAITIVGEPFHSQLDTAGQLGTEHATPGLGSVIQCPPGKPQSQTQLDERYHIALLGH